MAVFLLPQPLAVTASLLGLALGEALVGATSQQFAFNVARNTLQTAVAAIVINPCLPCGAFTVSEAQVLIKIISAASSYVVLGSVLTAGLHALYLHRSPIACWWQRRREDLLYQTALASLGVFAAMAAGDHPWAIVLVVFPIYIFYQAFAWAVEQRLAANTEATVETLADAVDQQDPRTNGHSKRVAELSRRIALHMGIDETEARNIYLAARVHDLGKLSINNEILAKEGPLTEEERHELQSYVEASARLVGQIPEFHGGRNYVLYIRERWDGRGYPLGLQGTQIPTGARIIAVADAFDAMTSPRPHRPPLPMSQVIEELRRNRYVQWDGAVVDALIEIIGQGPPTKREADFHAGFGAPAAEIEYPSDR
jgi:HD-GYP domain-containing protein (c-di-GMP phosphodiesterase class II)